MRVIIAMSGGVDSSVAAAFLLEAGYEVIGVTMQLWPSNLPYGQEVEGGCCSLSAVEDARAVANRLGIPYYVLNFHAEFEEKVVEYFVDEYLQGRTPNPCIVCNRALKFERLLEKAIALGGDYIATGHYARIERDRNTDRHLLLKGCDPAKDQSYVLYGLTQKQLEHTLFPLGSYNKTAIREKAAALGLRVADKPDSQEICFIPDNDYGRFIAEYAPESLRPGKICDQTGKILGEHTGISNFTIGQRKGLGIAAGVPLYVSEIRPETAEVVVGPEEAVFTKHLVASELNWIAFSELTESRMVEAKIRYSAKPAPAVITPLTKNSIKVEFQETQRAITPGQAVVFYDGDLVVGGGIIQ